MKQDTCRDSQGVNTIFCHFYKRHIELHTGMIILSDKSQYILLCCSINNLIEVSDTSVK
jgi:hypothetical protein